MTETKDLQKTVESVIAQIETMTIENQDHLDAANEFLKKCKQTARFVEERYAKELTAAQDKKKVAESERKAVVEKISFFTDKLTKAEKAAKSMMSRYLTSQEEIRREEERKRRAEEEERRLASAIDTGREEVLDKPITFEKPPEPELAKGTYTVDVWEFEIVDITKINPEFLIADKSAIGRTIRAMKERAQSLVGEGVKITCRKDIRSRA